MGRAEATGGVPAAHLRVSAYPRAARAFAAFWCVYTLAVAVASQAAVPDTSIRLSLAYALADSLSWLAVTVAAYVATLRLAPIRRRIPSILLVAVLLTLAQPLLSDLVRWSLGAEAATSGYVILETFPGVFVNVAAAFATGFAIRTHQALEGAHARARENALRLREGEVHSALAHLPGDVFAPALRDLADLATTQPEAADEALQALAELMRLTLRAAGSSRVPLRDECELVRAYAAVQLRGHGTGITLQAELGADTAAAVLPGHLLLPFVERAVSARERGAAGAAVLRIRSGLVDEGTLELVLCDELAAEAAAALRDAYLEVARELEDRHRAEGSVSCAVHVDNGPPPGVRVQIRIESGSAESAETNSVDSADSA